MTSPESGSDYYSGPSSCDCGYVSRDLAEKLLDGEVTVVRLDGGMFTVCPAFLNDFQLSHVKAVIRDSDSGLYFAGSWMPFQTNETADPMAPNTFGAMLGLLPERSKITGPKYRATVTVLSKN